MRILIVIFGLVIAACGSSENRVVASAVDATPVAAEKNLPPVATTKTGAAVIFASNFAGPLSVGEMAPVVIHVTPEYESGRLQIDIKAQEGLTIVGQTRFSEAFTGPYQFTHELMIGATQPGEYYLGVVANVITDLGIEEARAFSETILVGDPAAEVVEKATEQAGGNEVIQSYLPAVEEIITP